MKKGLGKGLDALFSDNLLELDTQNQGAVTLRLSQIEPDKSQPRKHFDDASMQQLADSIKVHGLIQPIIVSPLEDGRFRIIAGERRWRACRMAGLEEIPVLIREYSPKETSEVGLIENLQREDLNPIEEALGYQSLMDQYGLTQEQVAKTVSKSRAAVANALRLLGLSPRLLDLVKTNALSAGHARALLALDKPPAREKLADRIVSEGLSVRQTEALVRRAKQPAPAPAQLDPAVARAIRELEARASAQVGNKVVVHHRAGNKGTVEIRYYSVDELEKIMEILEGGSGHE